MTSFSGPRTWSSETLTSSLLNTHLRDNMLHLFEQIHSGSSTAGWTAFTPAWTNLTTTGGTNVGRKGYAGRTTLFYASFTFGAGSAVTGAVTLTLPETSIAAIVGLPIARCVYQDSGTAYVEGVMQWTSNKTGTLKAMSVSGSFLRPCGT